MIYKERMHAEVLIKFMKQLIKGSDKKIFLILDNLRVHHAKIVKAWLKEHQSEIEVSHLPSYSPELNPDENQRKGKLGRLKRTKARNLLERLQDFEQVVLRFMDVEIVPFTNNQGQNDLQMTKVQQKISGCFRSMERAKILCRVRSYLSTCRKQGMTATEALRLLFQGKNPEFMDTG